MLGVVRTFVEIVVDDLDGEFRLGLLQVIKDTGCIALLAPETAPLIAVANSR